MILSRQILITFIILIATILFFAFTNIDFIVQDNFYNFNTNSWILDRNLQPYKLIFYDGIKKILIFIAISALTLLIFFRKSNIIKEYKKGLLIFVLSAIFVPAVVIGLKNNTNMPCPKNTIHYGGIYPHTKVWEIYPKNFQQNKIRCWPAGHASAGFALLSLFFMFRTKKNKYIALYSALSIGWIMGLYKMSIGDHFLSHTVITMIIAWLIVLVIKMVIDDK